MIQKESIRKNNLFLVGREVIGSVEWYKGPEIKFNGNLVVNTLKEVEAIDISTDIATALGFKLTPLNMFELRVGSFILTMASDVFFYMCLNNVPIDIRYVHELQNLYYDIKRNEMKIDVDLLESYIKTKKTCEK